MINNCIFCSITAGKIPATIIDQNEYCIVIQDISPKAPVHYLIIPKKHIINLYDVTPEDAPLLQALQFMAQKLGKSLKNDQGFTLVANNGIHAGQTVFHMHYHFLSGKVFL